MKVIIEVELDFNCDVSRDDILSSTNIVLIRDCIGSHVVEVIKFNQCKIIENEPKRNNSKN